MERNARLILVSSFVIVTLLAAVLFYRWIQAPKAENMGEEHLIQFDGSVSGLSIGSEVRYLGVAIGRVSAIALSPSHHSRVDVGIGTRQPLPDAQNLVAFLEPQGITGLSIIEIENRPDLTHTFVAPAGVIPGYPSVISRLSGSASRIAGSLEQTLARLNTLLDDESIADLDATLRQTRVLTANLAGASAQLEELMTSAASVSRELENTMPDVRGLVRRLDREVLPTVVAAGKSLEAATRAVADSIGDNREELDQLIEQDLPTLIGVTDDLAITLQEFTRLMGNINSQPGALLYGEQVREVEIGRE
jgi:phospholipid/cholesterol/gamma-HCH transport system substrate-binding protein